MLKLIVTLTIVLASLSANGAYPILIGRRGCAGGVENSAEAYREAINRGYEFIEGHVRITADSVFVTSHDGKTTRLGGNMKVEQSTLSQLKSEIYTQTREDSVTYTGSTICTVNEFLDICRQGNAVAVLHLKNIPAADDCSRLPELASLIDLCHMRDRSIILTSSMHYIDFFRTHYPDMRLMFQADGKWPEYIGECSRRHVDVSVKKDFATPECVRLHHEKGLKVAIWTVNDRTELDHFSAMKTDMIITDLLQK